MTLELAIQDKLNNWRVTKMRVNEHRSLWVLPFLVVNLDGTHRKNVAYGWFTIGTSEEDARFLLTERLKLEAISPEFWGKATIDPGTLAYNFKDARQLED